MFLFEDLEENKRALYTGDFRYDIREDNREMRLLKRFVDDYKGVLIDYLYVDTTCLDLGRLHYPDQNKFPSRPQVVEKVIKIVEERGPRSIHIDASPLGCESIAIPIAEFLNISMDSIDAESDSMNEVIKYLLSDIKIPSVSSNKSNNTSIHVYNGSIFKLAKSKSGKSDCSKCDEDTLRIRATLKWIYKTKYYNHGNPDTWCNRFDDNLARKDRDFRQILYSNHSSDSELREFLSAIHFTEIYPISESFFHSGSDRIVIKHCDLENTDEDIPHNVKEENYEKEPKEDIEKKNEKEDITKKKNEREYNKKKRAKEKSHRHIR